MQAPDGVASSAPAGEAEYQSWVSLLRAGLGSALPACTTCKGTGEMDEDGTAYVCECGGSGVHMDDNEPYREQPGWKLHRCPDGQQCRTSHPGGCASGWCGHFGVQPERQYPHLAE